MLIYSESNVCFRSKDIDHHRPKHRVFWSFFHKGMMGRGEGEGAVQTRYQAWDWVQILSFEYSGCATLGKSL